MAVEHERMTAHQGPVTSAQVKHGHTPTVDRVRATLSYSLGPPALATSAGGPREYDVGRQDAGGPREYGVGRRDKVARRPFDALGLLQGEDG